MRDHEHELINSRHLVVPCPIASLTGRVKVCIALLMSDKSEPRINSWMEQKYHKVQWRVHKGNDKQQLGVTLASCLLSTSTSQLRVERKFRAFFLN